jgi:PAS domain S-box-containing protein
MKRNLESQVNLAKLSSFDKERLLTLLLDNSPDVVILLATDYTLRMVNRSFTRETGLAAIKVIGNSGLTLFPSLNKQLAYLLQKSRLSKQPVVSKANLQLPGDREPATIWQATVNPLFSREIFDGWALLFKKAGPLPPAQLLQTAPASHDSSDKAGLAKILQAVNEWLPFGIAEFTRDGSLLDVSAAFLENTGLTWDEAKDFGWLDLLPEEERDSLAIKWRGYCRQDSSFCMQYQIRCRNGAKRVISSRAQPVRDFDGKLTSWMVLNFDLTRQQQEREENWQSYQTERDFYNTVINQAEVGLAVYNSTNRLLRWSNANYQEFMEEAAHAQTSAGIQTKPGLPYVGNNQLDAAAAAILTKKIPQTNLLVEFQPPKQRERARWKLALVPLWAANAPTPDILVITVNISMAPIPESVRREPDEKRPLKLQAAEWEAVVDRLNKGLLVADRSGQVLGINQKAVDLLGFSPDSSLVPGTDEDFGPLYQLFTTDGAQIAADDWPHLRVMRGETLTDFEAELRQTDQDVVKRLRFNGMMLRGDAEQRDLMMLTCSDCTDMQQLIDVNEQLQVQKKQQQELIRRLNQTASQLDAGLAKLYNAANMYEIFNTAIKNISREVKADGGALCLFNRQEDRNEVYQVWRDEAVTRQLDLSEQPHAVLVRETQNPVYFTVEEARDIEREWFVSGDVKGCLAVPLIAEEVNCIGILILLFAGLGDPLGTVDFVYIKSLAAKYAAVIERARNQLEHSRLLINERRARVRAEHKAAKLSALLQSIREGINVIDASGNIILRNQMERQISRVPDEAAATILDYGNYRLLWPNNTPVPVGQLPGNRLLRGETVADTEFVLEHSDGTCFNVICSGSVIRDEEGQLALGIIITRDITEMRQLEESREAFIRTVSHDLRNPLTVVSARSQLLQRRLAKHNLAVEAEEAQVIYISARRMTQMIQEMFDSYRLESNNLKLNKNVIDFAAVVKDLISRIGFEEDLHRVQVEIAPGNYRIYADEERLERVVTNLIANALKYSPNDRPVLVKLAADAHQITITVTDFGMGIEPQDLPKVFQRYYRSKSVKEATGLGLGLYIVKLLVEAHHGKIAVESRVNEGSTFCVTLPLLREADEKWKVGNEQ